MGKKLAIAGMLFGIIGLIAAILIYLTLGSLPTKVKDFTFPELDKLKMTVTNFEGSVTSMDAAFTELQSTVGNLSTSVDANAKASVELGYGIDKLATDLQVAILGLDVTRLKGAAAMLKATDVSNVTKSASAFNSKIEDLKDSVSAVKSSVNSTKVTIVRTKATIEDFTIMASRLILLTTIFLLVVSLSLVAFSANMWMEYAGKEKKEEKKK